MKAIVESIKNLDNRYFKVLGLDFAYFIGVLILWIIIIQTVNSQFIHYEHLTDVKDKVKEYVQTFNPELQKELQDDFVNTAIALDAMFKIAIYASIIFIFLSLLFTSYINSLVWSIIKKTKYSAKVYVQFLILKLIWIIPWILLPIIIIMFYNPVIGTYVAEIELLIYYYFTSILHTQIQVGRIGPSKFKLMDSLHIMGRQFHDAFDIGLSYMNLIPFLFLFIGAISIGLLTFVSAVILKPVGAIIFGVTLFLVVKAWFKFYLYIKINEAIKFGLNEVKNN